MPCGKEAIAVFLADNLPRVGGSYRQFLERHVLGEGSHRRFFGREFAEGRGQLPPIFGEACPKGRQLSPIFWQRIYRACRLRRQARKGEQSMEDYRKPSKKVPKRVQNGTLEAPRSVPESRSRKVSLLGGLRGKNQSPKQGPFWSLERSFGAPIFEVFSGTLPERLLGDFGAQKASKREAVGAPFRDLFRKHENLDFRDPSLGLARSRVPDLDTFRTVFGVFFQDVFLEASGDAFG